MVTAYRRHEKGCKYTNRKKYPQPRKHKDCTCPVHMDGFLTTPNGEKIVMRGSLETRNWAHGQIKKGRSKAGARESRSQRSEGYCKVHRAETGSTGPGGCGTGTNPSHGVAVFRTTHEPS